MTEHPASSNPVDWNFVLHVAVKQADIEAARVAIIQGADVNYRHGDNLMPCLTAAINSQGGAGRYDMCKMLLDCGADPDLGTKRGFTPLHIATNNNNPDICELLLDYGADPNRYNLSGRFPPDQETALHEGARKNRRNCLKPLLDGGADPMLKDMHGKTVAQGVPEMWMDVLTIVDDYESLPRVDVDSDFTKADLLKKHNGICTLDNPVTWRQWPTISEKLEAKGESFSKAELIEQGCNGKSYLHRAAEARMLGAVVEGLNRQGESLSVAELQADPAFLPHLNRHHVPNALFTFDNMHLQGTGAVMRNHSALSETGQAEVRGVHQLAQELRKSASQVQGR